MDWKRIRILLNDLLALFFPRLCLLCHQPLLRGEKQICSSCFCDLPRTDYHRRKDNPLCKLLAGISSLQEAGAFLFFEREGNVQKLIHSFKYHGSKELAYELGRMAALEMAKRDHLYEGVDLLIPVPLHPRKERKRGYNQSEQIANGIASVVHKPVCTTILYRVSDTPTQTHKTLYERHQNVEKQFSITTPGLLRGKHLLLIDDVITTGATLLACLDCLATVPGVRLSVFSLSAVKQY